MRTVEAGFRIITDAHDKPASIHITAPHRIGEEVMVQIVERHMFGKDPKVAVLKNPSTRKHQKPVVIDPIYLQERHGRDIGIRIAALRIMSWPLGSVIRPPTPSTYF